MEADEGGAYPRDGIVTMGPHEQRAKRGMPRSTLGAFFVGWSLSRSVTYSVMPESMAPPTSMGRRSPDTWGSHTQVPTFASGVLFLHDDSTGKTRGLEKKWQHDVLGSNLQIRLESCMGGEWGRERLRPKHLCPQLKFHAVPCAAQPISAEGFKIPSSDWTTMETPIPPLR